MITSHYPKVHLSILRASCFIIKIDTMCISNYLFFFLVQGLVFSARQEDILVKTPLGSIVGTNQTSRHGTNFYSFRGIRYAKAPVGELRFKVFKTKIIFYQMFLT